MPRTPKPQTIRASVTPASLPPEPPPHVSKYPHPGQLPPKRLPLARSSMTVQPPSGDDTSVTVECIVVDESSLVTAQQHELQELYQAGWDFRQLGPLVVAVRVINC